MAHIAGHVNSLAAGEGGGVFRLSSLWADRGRFITSAMESLREVLTTCYIYNCTIFSKYVILILY